MKKCSRCKSDNINKDKDNAYAPFCEDCGFILDQKRAKREYEQENKEYE